MEVTGLQPAHVSCRLCLVGALPSRPAGYCSGHRCAENSGCAACKLLRAESSHFLSMFLYSIPSHPIEVRTEFSRSADSCKRLKDSGSQGAHAFCEIDENPRRFATDMTHTCLHPARPPPHAASVRAAQSQLQRLAPELTNTIGESFLYSKACATARK